MTDEQRNARNVKKYLRALCGSVTQHLTALDAEMNQPPTLDRGKHIAAIANALEIAKEEAWYFGLGEKLRKRS